MHTLRKLLNESLEGSRLGITNNFIQHGDTTCLLHTIAVAYYSCRLASIMHVNLSKKELIRGALLHDYFLYDWHVGKGHKIHGFTHPKAVLINAQEDFNLTKRERDIIVKHMFPLTPIPPKYKESIIVCLVDKGCSLYETFKRKNSYTKLRQSIEV